MPTGYTYKIEDGTITTLPEFAILCARAFGATIMMRDEPLDTPIPETFEPSDYSVRALTRAKADLLAAETMTLEEAQADADLAYARRMEEWRESTAKRVATNARYAAVRTQVEAWTPPTPDHEGLKTFMLEQIDVSVSDYVEPEPTKRPGMEWRAGLIADAQRSIEYHSKGDTEERERAAMRSKWVRDLRESLAPPALGRAP